MLPGLSGVISKAMKDICKTLSRAEEHREDRIGREQGNIGGT
jgi:hypothetical protein